MQLLLARHPNQLDAEHPIIIENLLEFSENQQQSAIDSIIEMLSDLHQFGQDSRYLKKMKGNLVWELKTRCFSTLQKPKHLWLWSMPK
jgi:hypothetical protein